MSTIEIPCEAGEVSDGYHTFNELYDHRNALFCALMEVQEFRFNPWIAALHDDGTMFDGMFIAGFNTPTGLVTYHLPTKYWKILKDSATRFDRAPMFDGHSANDVVERLLSILK